MPNIPPPHIPRLRLSRKLNMVYGSTQTQSPVHVHSVYVYIDIRVHPISCIVYNNLNVGIFIYYIDYEAYDYSNRLASFAYDCNRLFLNAGQRIIIESPVKSYNFRNPICRVYFSTVYYSIPRSRAV